MAELRHVFSFLFMRGGKQKWMDTRLKVFKQVRMATPFQMLRNMYNENERSNILSNKG